MHSKKTTVQSVIEILSGHLRKTAQSILSLSDRILMKRFTVFYELPRNPVTLRSTQVMPLMGIASPPISFLWVEQVVRVERRTDAR